MIISIKKTNTGFTIFDQFQGDMHFEATQEECALFVQSFLKVEDSIASHEDYKDDNSSIGKEHLAI